MEKVYNKITNSKPSWKLFLFNLVWCGPVLVFTFPGFGNTNKDSWLVFILCLLVTIGSDIICILNDWFIKNINELAKKNDELIDEVDELKLQNKSLYDLYNELYYEIKKLKAQNNDELIDEIKKLKAENKELFDRTNELYDELYESNMR